MEGFDCFSVDIYPITNGDIFLVSSTSQLYQQEISWCNCPNMDFLGCSDLFFPATSKKENKIV